MPRSIYQRLSQNPFEYRYDISPRNYFQESVLLPLLANVARMTSKPLFYTLCSIIIALGMLVFIVWSKNKYGMRLSIIFSALLLAHPVTAILLSWIGAPDCITFLSLVTILFTTSPMGLTVASFLGATNHPMVIFASVGLIILRALAPEDKIKFRDLVWVVIGVSFGTIFVKAYLNYFNIFIVTRSEFILMNDVMTWLGKSFSNLPATIFSLESTFWFVLAACYFYYSRYDKRYFTALSIGLVIYYSITVFMLDTTRVFSLIAWGASFHCLFHCVHIAQSRNCEKDPEFMLLLPSLAFIGLLTPKYFAWEGAIFHTPFNSFFIWLFNTLKLASTHLL